MHVVGSDVSVTAPPPTSAPRTVAELITAIEGMFHCVMGPPHAYLEFPSAPVAGAPVVRGVYSCKKYATRAWRADGESLLVQVLHEDFRDMLAHYAARFNARESILDGVKPLLFWRALPHVEEYAPRGDSYDANGSWIEEPQLYPVTVIRTRYWIPGLEVTNKDGVDERIFVREV